MDPILLALDTTDPLRALSAKKSGEENPSVKITHQRLTHRINKEHHRQNRTVFFFFNKTQNNQKWNVALTVVKAVCKRAVCLLSHGEVKRSASVEE